MATTITANGINFPDGSASAPSIGGTDTNTGLFTGSDIVGFATGGLERLRIHSNGRVSIGTSSASGLLHLQDGDNTIIFLGNSSYDDGVIQYYNGSVHLKTGSSNGDRLVQLSTAGSERLRIDANGDVMFHNYTDNIGSNSSGEGFEFRRGEALRISRDQGLGLIVNRTSDDGDLITLRRDGSGKADLGIRSNALTFDVAGSERVRIDNSGDVGINVTNPTERLHISGNLKVTAQIFQSTPADFWSQGNTFIELNGMGNLTHMGSYETCLTSNGYRDSDNEWKSYAINSTTGAAQIRLNPTGYIIFATEANKADGDTPHTVDERLRIKSDGETTIGTGSVNIAKFCQSGNKHQIVGQAADNVAALDVYSQHGSSAAKISFAVSDNRTGSKKNTFVVRGDGSLILDSTNNGYGGLKIYDDSAGDYNVRYVAGRNQSATSHVFMRSGRTQNQSPWADATPVEHARIARGGIAFGGDTAEVNTLQDYEEGTYTPVITCATSGGYNLSGSYNTMAYRKIGSLVHIQGYIAITSESGTPNGALRITLPKTAAALSQNADYTGIKILVRNHGSSNIYNQVAVCHGNGSYFNILFDNGNGASTYMTHAYVDTDWQFFISGGYIAT